MSKLINHTKKLMEKEEKLCIKILQTLREMLEKKDSFMEEGSTLRRILLNRYFKGDHSIGVNGPLSGAYAKTAQVGGEASRFPCFRVPWHVFMTALHFCLP